MFPKPNTLSYHQNLEKDTNFKSNLKSICCAKQKLISTYYLGIVIDEKLSWKPHLSAVASKLAKLCGLFYKLRLYVDKQVLKKVYYTLIYPILLYGVIC